MFMKEPEPGAPIAVPMKSGYVAAALVIAGFFVLDLGVMPSGLLELAAEAAQSLLG